MVKVNLVKQQGVSKFHEDDCSLKIFILNVIVPLVTLDYSTRILNFYFPQVF